ncbi:PP2C family protein-serine/threonine phosphatase [Modestobacter sp. VKM Ac-2985]|uniref:PP2C family protein-serine/threonine phosphatase n=1 Tax=Modestobacter sp. VKM Ac-2985 TaxID=3004139 RepID=UPI0022AB9099|nr:SpoIIE family protein phosphatase [Modestobacter sp. VKM Ac-2985]MCZ2839577.1 SpoIIE family protein phosphatase [Modestobacter sp. VKM Ac-2985]
MPGSAGTGPGRLEVIAAQFDAVIESAPLGIGLFDLQLRHVRVNPVLAEMNGLPVEQLLGRTPAELHPAVGGEAEALYREVLGSGRPRRDVPLTGAVGSRPDELRHWNASFFPVRHADEVIGLCVLVADVTAERELAQALAASEERYRRLAEDLQSSLLPPHLPYLAGADVAAVYQPSSARATVGGDFYDLVELDGSSWLMVIGDVEGTGPVAAARTAAARYAIRAAVVRTTDLVDVLRTVNEVLLRQGAPTGTCTIACVLAERIDDRVELRAVSAGHPLPLVLRHDIGAVAELGAPGSLLGILPEIDLRVATTTLQSGDVLVLYTDGVTEARYRDGAGVVHQFGEEHLRSVLAGARGGSAVDVAAAVETSVMEFQRGRRADDLAVLVLRATGGS